MGIIVARITSRSRHCLVMQGSSPFDARAGEMAKAGYPVRLFMEAVKVNRVFNLFWSVILKPESIGFMRDINMPTLNLLIE
ncbi:hypothetical protein FOZ70_01590 [Burkholderia sp. COPS]|uniref:hypothetical protein n=1 Tax=Burkholderia sp. COPS TaxID=2597663 RepID=UPI001CA526F1|nr:hypothetical protein [Burkholderia sp. COPS]MBW5803443.1 hypothetical protein [Burkholderia sp. COPS]